MSYGSLKIMVQDWVARGDLGTGSTLDDCIDLTEAKINRLLRVRAMETVYFRTLDTDARVPVPTGYREFRNVYLYRGTNTDDTLPTLDNNLVSELTMASLNDLLTDFNIGSTEPRRLARSGAYFYVGGKPVGTYGVGGIFYKDFTALSDSAPDNWLTTNAPDLLFYGCMEQINLYIKAYDQAEQWAGRFLKLIEDIQIEDRAERMSGGKIVTRSGVRGA